MRCIEDLRDIHKGKEIWIIGTGLSLEDFPREFFDDKIIIALNWTIVAFPDCTYWHGHHEWFREYLRDEHPELLKKCIISYPFPGPYEHGRIADRKEFFGKLISKPIWIKFWDTRPVSKNAFEIAVKYIMEKQSAPRGYRASMSVSHTAIQAAAIMGAKKIVLVGCEYRGPYTKCHGMGNYYRGDPSFSGDPRYEKGTQWLAEILAGYNIEVIRYYHKDGPFYKKGYQKIPWEVVKPKFIPSPKKMRHIEDLRDVHKGEEIWILGSGASLCDYPKDFFDGKLSITLNWTIVPFPRCTYWHGFHEPEREYMRDEHPEFLPKSIILYPFPGPFHHGRIRDPEKFFGKLVSQPIFMKFLDTRPHASKVDFEGIAKHIAEKTVPRGYRASGTITHTAIQAAAIMGAKRITLVGCEGRGPHAQCYGLKERYPRMDGPGVPLTENGIRWQVEALAKYGIEVIRYYNEDCIFGKKGYNKIPWKEVKIGEELPATGGSPDGGAPKVKKKVEMRAIEDLRDDHKDKEIWILGGGESLCDFPKEFFDDKISIALSWTIVGFPRCTYWHGHHERLREYLRDEHPEFLKKSIICNPFPGPFRHGHPSPEEFFGELVCLPIFLHFWDTRPFPGKPAYEEVIKCIIEKTVPRGYRASGNIAHTAIQAAAILGTKRIILAGVDSQGPHAKCYGMGEYWSDKKGNKAAPMTENCIRWQAEIFAKYGIEVIRYYNKDCPFSKKGYTKIPFEEVDPDRWGCSLAAQSTQWHSLSQEKLQENIMEGSENK